MIVWSIKYFKHEWDLKGIELENELERNFQVYDKIEKLECDLSQITRGKMHIKVKSDQRERDRTQLTKSIRKSRAQNRAAPVRTLFNDCYTYLKKLHSAEHVSSIASRAIWNRKTRLAAACTGRRGRMELRLIPAAVEAIVQSLRHTQPCCTSCIIPFCICASTKTRLRENQHRS